MDSPTPIQTDTQSQIQTENIGSKLLTIHNALLDTTFIPEISEMNEDKVKTIKYCLRK